MNTDQKDECMDWGRSIIEKWLDPDYQIAKEALNHKKWAVLPVPDILNPMEAEWLASAIQIQGVGRALGIAFEYKGEPEVTNVEAARDAILEYNGSNSWRYAIITSPNEEFLYYKDEANRFYLVCGHSDFVSQAYKCSWETARIMYIDEWVNLDHHNDQERRFLTELWNKYSQFRPA